MKKALSVFLSLVMLLSVTAGINFSAFANETVDLVINSNVKNAVATEKFTYSVSINDSLYNGKVVGKNGATYTVTNGNLVMPTTESATLTVDIGAKYSIYRKEFKKAGYETIAKSDVKSGVASEYTYVKNVADADGNELSSNIISKEEYDTATDNGENEVTINYENEKGNNATIFDIESKDVCYELKLGQVSKTECFYLPDEFESFNGVWTITSTYNTRKPATAFGVTTYYYSGDISVMVKGKKYTDTYTTAPATPDTAKNSAVEIVKAKIKTILSDAIKDLENGTDKKVYLATDIDEEAPTAASFTPNDNNKNITHADTELWRIVPYTPYVYSYDVIEAAGVITLNFDGELTHVHIYKATVVPPTCSERGYTLHECTCGRSYKDTYTQKVDHKYSTSKVTTRATTSANGVRTYYCNNCDATKKVSIPKIKSVSISATKYVYDGKYKKPSVTVKDSNGKKISNRNYSVAYSNNKNVGKATVTITFKNEYKGKVTKTFAINPKATSIKSVSALSKGFKVVWNKQSAQKPYYQIQYATNSKFTKGKKTVNVANNSTTSKKIQKLSAKKKYYVRIRTYKTVNGTKYYSAWSKAKTVTTKK